MAETRNLNALQDQQLIKMFKEFTGIDRELVRRALKRRFDTGKLKADLPSNLRMSLKSKAQ